MLSGSPISGAPISGSPGPGTLVGRGSTTGTATAQAAGTLDLAGVASAVATALAQASALTIVDAAGSTTGTASATGDFTSNFKDGAGAVLALADVRGLPDHYVNPANPPLGLPTAVHTLTVNGSGVDLSTPYFQVEDLTVSYDGKELTFTEIASGGIGNPAFAPEQAVLLDMDLGNGAFRWFTGAIRSRETIGQNNSEGFQYIAQGYQNLADELTLVNTEGRPSVEFTVGTTVTSVRSDGTDVVTIFSKSIQSAIQEIFEISASALNSIGIPATIGSPGLTQFSGNLPETTSFQNIGFTAAITQLAALETGVKVFYNDQQQAWNFPNLLLSSTAVVHVNSVNLLEAVFDVSTENRYTAVHLYADVDDLIDEGIASKTDINLNGLPGSLNRTEVALTSKWLPELESDWTIDLAHQGVLGTLEDENFWVYRRWSLPDGVEPELPGTPIKLWQKFNFNGVERWKRTHGRVNFRRREFISRYPLIHRGNPRVPGDVIGPIEVKMAYFPGGHLGATWTFISTTNSVGTPTYANTQIDMAEYPTDVRVPQSGFTGTAFTQFGVERELKQIVSKTEVTSANANAILRMHKDVVVTGDLPLEGDPIEQVLNLDRKVLLQHDIMLTGIQSTPAILTSYDYQFGKRGLNTLSLSTDVSGLIPGTI